MSVFRQRILAVLRPAPALHRMGRKSMLNMELEMPVAGRMGSAVLQELGGGLEWGHRPASEAFLLK